MRLALGIILSLTVAVMSLADEKKKNESDAVMAMYMEAAKPVAAHERLRTLAGKWNVVSKMWMSPTEPAMVARGTAHGRMILGNRFLQLDMTLSAPFPAQSLTILGFDRRTNDYTLVGYDTMGTYYVTAAGKPDEAGKRLLLDGEYAQPPSGNLQKYRFTFEQSNPKEHRLLLHFAMADGKDMLVNEVVMTRAK